MPVIIAIAGTKGGVGKSTLAANVAYELHSRGYRTLAVDLDPQGTLATWAEVAAELAADAPPVIAMGDNVRTALPGVASGFDAVVLDCPGRAAKRVAGALFLADVALLPCGPGTAAVWAMTETLELVGEVQAVRPELCVRAVVNGKTPTAIGKAVRQTLTSIDVEVLGAELGQRVAFAECLASGEGVTGYQPKSAAAKEVRRLVDEVSALAGLRQEAAHVA